MDGDYEIMKKLDKVIPPKFPGLLYLYFFTVILCCISCFPLSAEAKFICLDESCVGCHVLSTKGVNVSLTHPNLIIGCITCHAPECLPGLHKNGIRELDAVFYNYTGTAASSGCNVCHGAPPQALCIGGLVFDHCLDPSGCNPAIFNCVACHPNFNGTPAHIYPKIPGAPFAPIAGTANCLACHGLSLLVGRSGVHTTHFITKLMTPSTASGFGISIDCDVCHPDLSVNLGADHLVCLPGTSNAWLPGKVPVVFNPLLPQIGVGDLYLPGPLGGTGSCVVYCHSNGATPPTNIFTAPLGYPGSNLPLPWNVPFPIDPILLDCGCCHAFPPVTHSAGKSDCSKCHPTPIFGAAPTSQYHINGIPDLWKYLAAASPMVPLIFPPPASLTASDLILSPGLGINGFLDFPELGPTALNTHNPQMALLSFFSMGNNFHNPIVNASLTNNVFLNSLSMNNNFFSLLGLNNTSASASASALLSYPFGGVYGLSGRLVPNFIPNLGDVFANPLNNLFPAQNILSIGRFNHNYSGGFLHNVWNPFTIGGLNNNFLRSPFNRLQNFIPLGGIHNNYSNFFNNSGNFINRNVIQPFPNFQPITAPKIFKNPIFKPRNFRPLSSW